MLATALHGSVSFAFIGANCLEFIDEVAVLNGLPLIRNTINLNSRGTWKYKAPT